MRLVKKNQPAFVLENKFFDKLTNSNDIALYAIFVRLDGIPWSEDLILESFNLSKKSFDKSVKKLLEIGFLELDKDI